jgi:hypothetical protein
MDHTIHTLAMDHTICTLATDHTIYIIATIPLTMEMLTRVDTHITVDTHVATLTVDTHITVETHVATLTVDIEEVHMPVITTDTIKMATMTKPTHQATLHGDTPGSPSAITIHIYPTTSPYIHTLLDISTTQDATRQRGAWELVPRTLTHERGTMSYIGTDTKCANSKE